MSGHIPGPKRERLYEKKWPTELFATLPPLVTTGAAAVVNLNDPAKRTIGLWLVGAAVWLFFASAWKVLHAYSQDREKKKADDHAGLKGALAVLYSTIAGAAGIKKEDGRLRVTIHRVVEPPGPGRDPEELEQMLPYIGGKGNAPPRRFSIRSGIIGKAAREKAAIAGSRQNEDYESYVAELVRDWAYTEADARKIDAGRRSWMAVPILGPGDKTRAVVFLDSSEPDFFSQEMHDLILAGCRGITAYTKEVYK